MFKRTLQFILSFVLVGSLTNGILLLGQVFAWTTMIVDRSDEMGIERAIISSIEGQELCDVCVVVINETSRQQTAGSDRIVDVFAKTVGEVSEQAFTLVPPSSTRVSYPICETRAVDEIAFEPQGPPPRFEV